jgi:formylglycine-generating enzyme required for sulfatase activity
MVIGVRPFFTTPFALSVETVKVSIDEHLLFLFFSQVFFPFESISESFTREATPLFIPKENAESKNALPQKDAAPAQAPSKSLLPFIKSPAPSKHPDPKGVKKEGGDALSLPFLIRSVKVIVQNMNGELLAQQQPLLFLEPPQESSVERETSPENPAALAVKKSFIENTPSAQKREIPNSLVPVKNGESLAVASTPLQLAAPIATEEQSESVFTKESLFQPAKMPLIATHGELTALFQTQALQLALPLTFIVPYPFEKKPETFFVNSYKGAKKERSSKRGERRLEEEAQAMAFIPKGPLLLENGTLQDLEAFAIATTPVTNGQFVLWLNALLQLRQVVFNRGEVCDLNGNLLCQTKESISTSQIHTLFHQGELSFTSLRFTEHHPVVHVTWLGALRFCEDNGFSLPREGEWERAAGMSPETPEGGLKKFLYGFGRDEIDPTLANYRARFASLKPLENRTTPVGFYNGATFFAHQFQTYKTEQALSPFGCYDMSGNVSEWILEKLTKGGSYESPPEELTIHSRKCSDPKKGDAFTGFRVALS